MQKAVFLDKDGTLVEDLPFNVDPDEMRLTDGALQGTHLLHHHGYALVVVSIQAGVAHGYFDEHALGPVEKRIRELLASLNVPLAGFYYCPHHPKGTIAQYARTCDCRKPAPGLILRAAHEHGIDLARSWLVGDRLSDIEAGHRAGCKAGLVDNGHESRWVCSPRRRPEGVVPGLIEAAWSIVSSEPAKRSRHPGSRLRSVASRRGPKQPLV